MSGLDTAQDDAFSAAELVCSLETSFNFLRSDFAFALASALAFLFSSLSSFLSSCGIEES